MISHPAFRLFNTFLLLLTLATTARAQEPFSNGGYSDSRKKDSLFFESIGARARGEDKQAAKMLADFVRLYPSEPAAFFDLAKLNLQFKQAIAAEENIRKAVALDNENPWYRALLAEILAQQNKYEEAASIYDALSKTERYGESYMLKAVLFYKELKKYEQALDVLNRLIGRVGNDEELLLQKQEIYLRMNKLDAALEVARSLIKDNPDEPRYIANMADLYNNNGFPEKAKTALEDGLKRFPDDPILELSLAEYFKNINNSSRYHYYLNRLVVNTQLDAEVQVAMIQQFLQSAGTDTAQLSFGEQLAAKLTAARPENPLAWVLYGQVLTVNGKVKQAASPFKNALKIDPSKFEVWQQLLFGYTGSEDADSLILYSEKAIRYYPNQAMVHYLNGIGYLNKRDFIKSIKSFNRAIGLQPEEDARQLAGMYSSLGDAFFFVREYPKSDSAYEKSLRLDPMNPSTLNNYAYYLSERGERLEKAEQMSRKSLELRPGEATFLDTYGWILYKQGKFQDARKYLNDALQANPDADGTIWDHLGDVLFRLDDKKQAVEHWKRAKERGTDNQLIDKKIAEQKLYE